MRFLAFTGHVTASPVWWGHADRTCPASIATTATRQHRPIYREWIGNARPSVLSCCGAHRNKGEEKGAPRPVPLGWDGKPTGAVGSTGRSSGCEVSGFRPAARLSLAGEARLVFYARHVCALAAVPAIVNALFTEKVLLLSLIARPLRYFWAIFRRHTPSQYWGFAH